ncbi:MAG: Na/Pi cotransporter family protein [Ruminococcus sp.]|nr:Na/Pi cotransporter family protein [Ruminococcus sp.]
MGITDFLGLLGGLALFLYGMQMMSNGLEAAAGNRMKQILEKLTANRFLGVAVGAGITAVIQSSSATTVMVVGFVNSGMMTLNQAVWIIMGANIGTTITGQLIALDVGMLAPLFAFIGVALIVFLKKPKIHHIGQILAGLGVLFIGMDMMGAAMEPLQQSEEFISLMTKFSNPMLGILVGAVFTAIIQSSSASVGILQALVTNGLIPFGNAVYILFGQNIGTCITAVLASIGTNRNAKRTTIIHLLFNITGTIIFTIICLASPLEHLVVSLTPNSPAAQIANMHTLFNCVTTMLLLPIGQYMAKLAERILPDSKQEPEQVNPLFLLMDDFDRVNGKFGYSAIHLDMLGQEINKMLTYAKENVERGFLAVIGKDMEIVESMEKTEDQIDYLNKEISQYISKILIHDRSGQDIATIEEYFLITGNVERIGDHALNIGGYVKTMEKHDITFSQDAKDEIYEMKKITQNALETVMHRDEDKMKWLSKVAAMEQQMDDMTESYRNNHLERMRQGKCSEEACVLYSEMLTDFERIGDHLLNIAQSYSKMTITV